MNDQVSEKGERAGKLVCVSLEEARAPFDTQGYNPINVWDNQTECTPNEKGASVFAEGNFQR